VLPAAAATMEREIHHQQESLTGTPSRLRYSFDYSDGAGRVAMQKIQAEPGPAKQCDIHPDGSFTISVIDTTPARRWVGSGRKIINNKGNRVMEYEPYFSVTHRYETAPELVESGVTPLFHYDPLDRVVRVDLPDGTFSRTEFDAWKQTAWDGNDTVLASDWYAARAGGALGSLEQDAADKTALHDDTPSIAHADSLGRSIYAVEHNRFADRLSSALRDERYATLTRLDVEGNRLRSSIREAWR
jgi:hypothetical protein